MFIKGSKSSGDMDLVADNVLGSSRESTSRVKSIMTLSPRALWMPLPGSPKRLRVTLPHPQAVSTLVEVLVVLMEVSCVNFVDSSLEHRPDACHLLCHIQRLDTASQHHLCVPQ